MSPLDPDPVFDRIRTDLPAKLRKSFMVVGSLAAAYHFRRALTSRAINTKDADLVVFHAADVDACLSMAGEFLERGWTRRESFGPALPRQRPLGKLPFVRLYPPGSLRYFIEFLGLPARDQIASLSITPVRLDDGWHGIPRFRFMGVVAEGVLTARSGLLYAQPSMMALANLLSHRELGSRRVSEPLGGRKVLRSAKDLGRVLAIAYLTPREEREGWIGPWSTALRKWFPKAWRIHVQGADKGLRSLLANPDALSEAHHASTFGLLAGMEVTEEALGGVAEQLLADVLEPMKSRSR